MLELRLEYLADTAETALGEGTPPALVASMLMGEGLSSQAALDIVSVRARKVRGAARHSGLVRLLGGLGLGVLGSALVLLALLQLLSGIGQFGLVLGLSLAVVGFRLFVSGMHGVLAGRE